MAEVVRARVVSEMARIIQLPIQTEISDEETDGVSRLVLRRDAYEAGVRIWKSQAQGILDVHRWGSFLAPIPVGGGKTGLAFLTCKELFRLGHRHLAIFAPPTVIPQMMSKALNWWRARADLNLPFYSLHKRDRRTRQRMVSQRLPGAYLFPYSLLSGEDGEELLRTLDPSGVVMDEMHYLSAGGSARRQRFGAWVQERARREEPVVVCGMTGTISDRSVREWWHLGEWVLRERCPLPSDYGTMEVWDQILASDSQAGVFGETPVRIEELLPLVRWARGTFQGLDLPETREGCRRAFRVRFKTTPGIIYKDDYEYGGPLFFDNVDVGQPNQRVRDLVRDVEDKMIAPNGDQFSLAIHGWRYLNELRSGFYHDQVWPSDAPNDVLERSKLAHELHQEYLVLLRDFFKRTRRQGLDTPFLVGTSFERHKNAEVGDSDLYAAYVQWKTVERSGETVKRESIPVLVDDYKIRAAAEWAVECQKRKPKSTSGAVLWVHHRAVLQWVVQACRDVGVDALAAPAGSQYDKMLLDEALSSRIVVASITAHGTGKELQHFQNTLTIEWPRKALRAEQMIGRLHREGQLCPELHHHSMHATEQDWLTLAASLVDAVSAFHREGSPQKVLAGEWTFEPKIYPPNVLAARGLQAKSLDDAERRILSEKFDPAT